MVTLDEAMSMKLNSSELIDVIAQKTFDYERALRYMDGHVLYTLQANAAWLALIFAITKWMRYREPFKLDLLASVWNLTFTMISFVCALTMTHEYFDSLLNKGPYASLCTTRDTFFTGVNGHVVFILHAARLFQLMETLFNVLRKRPVQFVYFYYNALSLSISWYSYAKGSPFIRHEVYTSALLHVLIYIYFNLKSLNFDLRNFAICIRFAKVAHFAYTLYWLCHLGAVVFIFGEQCQMDTTTYVLTMIKTISCMGLIVSFYSSKYTVADIPEKKVEKTD